MDDTSHLSQPDQPFGGILPQSGRPEFGQASASAVSMKWAALHDAAAVIAPMAGMAPEPMTAELRNFPAIMRDAGGWRQNLAEQGIFSSVPSACAAHFNNTCDRSMLALTIIRVEM